MSPSGKRVDWTETLQLVFGARELKRGLIACVPNRAPVAGPSPFLVIPAGGYDLAPYEALAWLPDDEEDPAPPAPPPPEDEDEEPPPAETDPEEEWPPATPPTDESHLWPPVDEFDDSEEALDEALDEALERAFEDEEPEPDDTEAPEEHPLEDAFFRPQIPPGWRGWLRPDVDPDLTTDDGDSPSIDDLLDEIRPRWRDLPPERPQNWPFGEDYDPGSRWGLPDEFKPKEDGWRLGRWRFYVVPEPGA